MEVLDNWDALGMRASGSNDVVLKNCVVPEGSVQVSGTWGDILNEGSLPLLIANNIGLVGVSLGIAEAARDLIVQEVKTRRKAPNNRILAERYPFQHGIAELEINLAACRAMLARTFLAADAYLGSHPPGVATLDELHQLYKDGQCTKHFVTHAAIAIVDCAMALSGGAGYLSKHPLSRLYRDVRAGPFMQAYSPNEAFEYIGKVTLGLDPRIDV